MGISTTNDSSNSLPQLRKVFAIFEKAGLDTSGERLLTRRPLPRPEFPTMDELSTLREIFSSWTPAPRSGPLDLRLAQIGSCHHYMVELVGLIEKRIVDSLNSSSFVSGRPSGFAQKIGITPKQVVWFTKALKAISEKDGQVSEIVLQAHRGEYGSAARSPGKLHAENIAATLAAITLILTELPEYRKQRPEGTPIQSQGDPFRQTCELLVESYPISDGLKKIIRSIREAKRQSKPGAKPRAAASELEKLQPPPRPIFRD